MQGSFTSHVFDKGHCEWLAIICFLLCYSAEILDELIISCDFVQDCLALWKDLKAEILDDIWCEWCVLQYTIGLLGSLRSHHFEQFDLAPTHKCEGNFDKDTLRVSYVIDPEECAIDFLVPLSIILHNLSFDTVGFRALQVPYLLQVSMHTLQS